MLRIVQKNFTRNPCPPLEGNRDYVRAQKIYVLLLRKYLSPLNEKRQPAHPIGRRVTALSFLHQRLLRF